MDGSTTQSENCNICWICFNLYLPFCVEVKSFTQSLPDWCLSRVGLFLITQPPVLQTYCSDGRHSSIFIPFEQPRRCTSSGPARRSGRNWKDLRCTRRSQSTWSEDLQCSNCQHVSTGKPYCKNKTLPCQPHGWNEFQRFRENSSRFIAVKIININVCDENFKLSLLMLRLNILFLFCMPNV